MGDLVSRDHVISKLNELGMSPEVIAYTTDLDISTVKSVLTLTKRSIHPEDERLAKDVRKLAHACISRAFTMLEFMPVDTQLSILRSVIPSTARLIGAEASQEQADLKIALDDLLSGMVTAANPDIKPIDADSTQITASS